MIKTTVRKIAILASVLMFSSFAVYAELQDLSSEEMKLVNGEDGIALKLDLGLGADPLVFEDVTVDPAQTDFDPNQYPGGAKLRPIGLGVAAGDNADSSLNTTSAENSRRFALRYPKGESGVGDEPPFFLLLDNFQIALSLEQVNVNLEEIQEFDGNNNLVASANAIQLSFPGLVDIKKLSIGSIHVVPQSQTTINGVDVGDLGINADGSNLGSFDTQNTFCDAINPTCGDGIVNLGGLDADITLQIGGKINIFPAGTNNDNLFGATGAVDLSSTTDVNNPVLNATQGYIR